MEQALLDFIARSYAQLGWAGVVVLMALESACIPLPSELIMPLAGWMLIREQGLSVLYVLVAGAYGALGCTLGSVAAYGAGMRGGRPILEKYGRYIFMSQHDLDLADQWSGKYGNWGIFASRLLPVVRTFISLPAGITRMSFIPFVIYSFAGSFIWCTGLAWGGYLLGEHWENIRRMMRPFDPLIGVLILALVAYYIYRHVKHFNQTIKLD